MNKLFEDFVTQWLRDLLAGREFRVVRQRRSNTILWNADLDRPYASVIPDLLIEHVRDTSAGRLPIDAKYKPYEQRNISAGDIYQSFVYAFAYGGRGSILPRSILLYPASVLHSAGVRLHVRRTDGSTGAEVLGVGVHVPTALAEAEAGKTGVVGASLVHRVRQAMGGPIA